MIRDDFQFRGVYTRAFIFSLWGENAQVRMGEKEGLFAESGESQGL